MTSKLFLPRCVVFSQELAIANGLKNLREKKRYGCIINILKSKTVLLMFIVTDNLEVLPSQLRQASKSNKRHQYHR